MNYETVGDKMIFYSLGNFIFDTDYQRAQFNTEKGILLKLHFTENSGKHISMKRSAAAVCRGKHWTSRLSIRLPRKKQRVPGKPANWRM